jgi:MATE family multidrug resistance protein
VACLAMSVVAGLLWPYREEIAALLTHEALAQAHIVSYLSYNLISTPFSIASTVMGGIMTGSGATKYNLMVFGGTLWLVRLPLGWLLGHILWGTASGVFAAMLFSQILQSCIMFYVVLHGDWARYALTQKRVIQSSTASTTR